MLLQVVRWWGFYFELKIFFLEKEQVTEQDQQQQGTSIR